MTVIRDPGNDNQQGPSRSASRGQEVFDDIVVGLIYTAVGAFFAVILCGLISLSVMNAVGYVAHETGLLQAWEALVTVGEAGPLTPESFAELIWSNLMFGAAVGAVLGLFQFVRRWRIDRHRKLIETVISPSSLAALSYGVTCLALHVAIGMLVAWAAGALYGVFLPSPADLLSGDGSLMLQHMRSDIGGGGFGGGVGETIIGLLGLLIFLLLLVALAIYSLFAFSGWTCSRFASAVTHIASEGAVGAVASGLGMRGVALLLRCAVTRHGTVSEGVNAGIDEDDLKDAEKLGFHVIAGAAISGALHALIYAAVLFTVPAVFGIAVIAK